MKIQRNDEEVSDMYIKYLKMCSTKRGGGVNEKAWISCLEWILGIKDTEDVNRKLGHEIMRKIK